METIGNKNIQSQFLGEHPIVRTYKGDELINEYKPLYNPPSDWKDIRTDCPENSIALYAAHSNITNPNYTIEKVTGSVKYTVVGNPTIENGIVSGFSSSDYLQISNFDISSNSFEIKCGFRTSSDISTEQLLFASRSGSTTKIGLTCYTNNNLLFYYLNSSGAFANSNLGALSANTD